MSNLILETKVTHTEVPMGASLTLTLEEAQYLRDLLGGLSPIGIGTTYHNEHLNIINKLHIIGFRDNKVQPHRLHTMHAPQTKSHDRYKIKVNLVQC